MSRRGLKENEHAGACQCQREELEQRAAIADERGEKPFIGESR
jgi:glutamyl/glutaminyl-tRNA synthetase